MEKQYGAEKTDAIIEDAWRRYVEMWITYTPPIFSIFMVIK